MTQTGSLPASTLPLVDGAFYALGASIDASVPRSFIDPAARGWLPVQCYVIRDGEQFLLVDTGLTGHRRQIQAGIDALVGGSTDRRLAMTRREMDCMLNMTWILPELDINTVHFAGDISPLDFFESMDAVNAEGILRSTSDVRLDWLKGGSRVAAGRYTLEAVRPVVRLLSSYWYYEPALRTLFSSDFWAFVTVPQESGPVAIEAAGDAISVDAIHGHLMAKFDWLRGIDPTPVIEDLDMLFARYDIERICPNYGAIIEGRETIRRLKDNTIEALRRAGTEPRRSVLSGFDWEKAA